MKENKLTFQAMSNEDSSFPGSNCIDDQPKRIAKSTTSITEIITSGSIIGQAALFNVSAISGGLQVLDHESDSALVLAGKTDISINKIDDDYAEVKAVTTDLSDFANLDKMVIYGFTGNSNNNAKVSIVGTPTASNISIATTNAFTSEAAGDSITLARWNDADLQTNEDIDFAYVNDYNDYFLGQDLRLDQYYKNFGELLVNATCLVSLYTAAAEPSLGLFYAGSVRAYGRSQYGYSKDIRDNSIYRKSANGSLNQVNRVVNFDATVPVSCSRQQSIALENLFKYDNENYMVFIVREDDSDGLLADDIIYGKIEQKPRLIWDLPNRKSYNVKITQVGGFE